jgi:hypothetical protein
MEKLDFAPHFLEARKKINDAYILLNEKDYIPAATLVDEAIVELRLMRNAIKTHIKE